MLKYCKQFITSKCIGIYQLFVLKWTREKWLKKQQSNKIDKYYLNYRCESKGRCVYSEKLCIADKDKERAQLIY